MGAAEPQDADKHPSYLEISWQHAEASHQVACTRGQPGQLPGPLAPQLVACPPMAADGLTPSRFPGSVDRSHLLLWRLGVSSCSLSSSSTASLPPNLLLPDSTYWQISPFFTHQVSLVRTFKVLKIRQQTQNRVTHAKPQINKINPNLKFWLCQKQNLKQSIRSFPISICQVICLINLCPPL